MTRIFERTGFLLLLAAVFALSTFPARAGAPETTEIQRIESYLNALHTLEARFVQNNPDGSYALGKLYLKRPGQLRFEYDPPIPLRLYANGDWLIHVDTELEQVSYYPLDETPAHFLLRKDISLRKGLKVRHYERAAQVIRVELVDEKNPDIGSVTLTFADSPLQLRAWTVSDAQGLRTELALIDARFDGPIDPGLFEFVDPFTGNSN